MLKGRIAALILMVMIAGCSSRPAIPVSDEQTLVMESSGAANALEEQAALLEKMVATFRVSHGESLPASSPAALPGATRATGLPSPSSRGKRGKHAVAEEEWTTF